MTITRFAPSPTGYLHLGHAHSALIAEAAAREAGGTFLLRIEDIDGTRCRPEFIAGIAEDLAWLGLDWPRPVRRQSQHMDDYRAALDRLASLGLVYPCFCTRQQIAAEIAASGHAPHGPDGPVYPGTCRHLDRSAAAGRIAGGDPHAWRLDVAAARAATGGALTWIDETAGVQRAEPEVFGDVVLARKETPASYHLAVTVDDALQGVSLVTRGVDLFPATHVHRLLQALLDLPVPRYRHHRLLTDETGRRYAKRDRSLTLRTLREAGRTPAEVRAMAGFGQK
ncbi:MAG: tRNA glutamyl-Q(34) synthetase GluQRS [Alphaproteobacteria bacterium]|nr:tRNA glutamyl-Q(34) synthetase GluQRS [Alphaproteobacteria bacterium]